MLPRGAQNGLYWHYFWIQEESHCGKLMLFGLKLFVYNLALS